MSTAPGQKAKLVNVLDNVLADELQAVYTIEVVFSKSPEKGVKCGAIVVFRDNTANLDIDPTKHEAVKEKMEQALSEQTQVMDKDPEYFRETDGRWISWALERALQLFDKTYNTDADIVIKCPPLKIRQKISRGTIMSGRGDLRSLFSVAWDIDRLLSKKFKYDPWSRSIRRGRIGAEFSKR